MVELNVLITVRLYEPKNSMLAASIAFLATASVAYVEDYFHGKVGVNVSSISKSQNTQNGLSLKVKYGVIPEAHFEDDFENVFALEFSYQRFGSLIPGMVAIGVTTIIATGATKFLKKHHQVPMTLQPA